MATVKCDFRCDLTKPIKVEYLDGNMFTLDNGGNTINVYCYEGEEPATLGGSVSANVIRPDGTTVPVSGAIDGNKAYVILPQAAYAVPGHVTIIIKVTQSTTVTTIAAIVANNMLSSTDTIVDPGTIIPSVQALIAQIETAVGSIPADYSALLATLAADYSSSKTYAVGDYAWQAGVLKRCIVPITTAETYTAAHWTNAVLGDDLSALKSAIDDFDTAGVVPLPADGTKSFGGAYYVLEDGVCTVTTPNGATTAQSFAGRFYNNTSLPSGVIPGGIYKIVFDSNNNDVYGVVTFYKSGGAVLSSVTVYEDTVVTVPINAVGLLMRYYLNASKTITGSAIVSEFDLRPQLTMKSVGAELDQRTAAVVDCVNDIKSVDYPVGKLVRTRGFATPGDFGGALYEIKAPGSDTVNNCTVFKNNNGLIIKRVFDEPFIYLESLDVENVAWSTIEAIIEASGITDVRAYSIMLDHAITVSNFNFTFTVLRSSAPIALRIVDASNRRIIGKNIIATYADEQIGLQIINNNSNVIGNYIDIRDIRATKTCVQVAPLNKLTDGSAKGILENEYHFGRLQGVKYNQNSEGPLYGIHVSISGYKVDGVQILNEDGLPPYAFEGEDHYWVDIISVKNTAGNGTGVNFAIETATTNYVEGKTDYGTSVFGTITGVTFHNLSVEECDVGVRMRCGEASPVSSSRTESGIKSVYILNMRTRESLRYFDIIGWLRDIYIRPTSKIYLNRIGYRTALGDSVDGIEYDSETDTYKYPIINTSREAVVIDAYVSNGSVSGMNTYRRYQGIGGKLIAANNIMFIAERTTDQVIVTTSHDYDNTHLPIVVEEDENNEYVARCFYENSYPCADMFYIMDDLSGSAVNAPNTVVLDLREYYYDTSAVGLKVSVPENCECFVRFAGSNRVKLGDSANERKTYTVSQYFKRPSTLTKTHYISVDG